MVLSVNRRFSQRKHEYMLRLQKYVIGRREKKRSNLIFFLNMKSIRYQLIQFDMSSSLRKREEKKTNLKFVQIQ